MCRPDLTREGEAEYTALTMEPAHNAVGTWSMTMSGHVDMAAELQREGWGIDVVDEYGRPVLAGVVDWFQEKWDGKSRVLTLRGFDDNLLLRDRVAHPQPTSTAPPYSTDAYDVMTAKASTVLRSYVSRNLGPSAIGPRKVAGLTLGADPLIGPLITARARWTNLLEFEQGLALIGGLGFRIARVDGEFEFQVYEPVDRSDRVVFSVENGNLESYTRTVERSSANYVYAGGGGELVGRTIREGGDSAEIVRWGRRVEKFADQRHTTDATELDQEIARALEEGRGTTSLELSTVDAEGSAYGVDYALGDTVTAIAGDEVVTQAVQRMRMSSTTDAPHSVRPVLGTPGPHDPLKLLGDVRELARRMRNLEAR